MLIPSDSVALNWLNVKFRIIFSNTRNRFQQEKKHESDST